MTKNLWVGWWCTDSLHRTQTLRYAQGDMDVVLLGQSQKKAEEGAG